MPLRAARRVRRLAAQVPTRFATSTSTSCAARRRLPGHRRNERLATPRCRPSCCATRCGNRATGCRGGCGWRLAGAKGLSDGNAFRNHGPAVNLLLAGRKRWFFLRDGEQYPTCGTRRWLGQPKGARLWACTQEVGDVVYVPAGVGHAVMNDGECLALAAQLDQLTFRDALHVAAAAGRAATVRALLDSEAWEAEATNGIGETPRPRWRPWRSTAGSAAGVAGTRAAARPICCREGGGGGVCDLYGNRVSGWRRLAGRMRPPAPYGCAELAGRPVESVGRDGRRRSTLPGRRRV